MNSHQMIRKLERLYYRSQNLKLLMECYSVYHVEKDKMLRIVLSSQDRRKLFESAHVGVLGGHLRSAKLHGQLAKHYWWPGMQQNIIKWSQSCKICDSHQVGMPIHASLTPIPVAGLFDRVGIDVIKFPTTV